MRVLFDLGFICEFDKVISVVLIEFYAANKKLRRYRDQFYILLQSVKLRLAFS